MSMILQNDMQKEYILKVVKEIRLIKQSKLDWSVQHVLRFASLIKVEDSIRDIILKYDINGSNLFNLQFLSSNIEYHMSDRTFFPLYKLFHIVTAILQLTDNEEEGRRREESRSDGLLEERELEEEVDIAEEVVVGLKEQLEKLNNTSVMELGSGQVARMLKNIQMVEECECVRKWNVDGFGLICIMNSEFDRQNMCNYFSSEDIRLLRRLSQLFLHLYFHQFSLLSSQQTATVNDLPLDALGIEFNDLQFDPNSSFHQSQYGVSETDDRDDRQEEFAVQPIRNSNYGVSQRGSVGVSEYGVSQRGSVGVSEYAASVRGSVAMSELGSARGSTRDSVAGSVYASSEIMEEEPAHEIKKEAVIAVSSIEDDSIMATLMAAALRLPFNLLNLQPLQRIKIASIPYPFTLSRSPFLRKETSTESNTPTDTVSQRSESIYDLLEEDEEGREFKVFNLTGAKFGRNPENDFSYPDELSISGRHAQIVFKDQSYYLRDLGSKTGTFLYISQRKPLILSDEQLVQLSYEVEFKVLIIKNDVNEGIIKFEFKKPQNEPPYRAILKNNNTVRIGKAENSHIRLSNQSISSYHAQIKYEEGRFIMYDCNTRTGTWLRLSSKGVRSADRRLSRLDIIRISSKKTFLVQDMTEGIEFATCADTKYKDH